ncbi:hypothetical protein BDA99DRAFT_259098 [Phascolomyces articulosus]|uniref:Uncharacterized protein n=1 Tax=Phascolomyces articulosus TaxID=60185 RepID=A0AAD5JP33_9FUNG|nr:hypothetical protein BDA99DRAFT_259098 [Phascolomyces articulosus]
MASRNRLKQTSLNYFFKANSNLPSSSPIRETPVTVSTPVDTIINNIADGDEEEEGQTIPRPRKRNRIIRVEEEEGDDNNNDETTQQTLKPPTLTEDEDEDDIPPTSSPYKRRLLQRKKVMIIDDDDDDSENALDDTTVPDKNKHTQHNEINGQEEDEDDEDEDNIQDDLDFLGDNGNKWNGTLYGRFIYII